MSRFAVWGIKTLALARLCKLCSIQPRISEVQRSWRQTVHQRWREKSSCVQVPPLRRLSKPLNETPDLANPQNRPRFLKEMDREATSVTSCFKTQAMQGQKNSITDRKIWGRDFDDNEDVRLTADFVLLPSSSSQSQLPPTRKHTRTRDCRAYGGSISAEMVDSPLSGAGYELLHQFERRYERGDSAGNTAFFPLSHTSEKFHRNHH